MPPHLSMLGYQVEVNVTDQSYVADMKNTVITLGGDMSIANFGQSLKAGPRKLARRGPCFCAQPCAPLIEGVGDEEMLGSKRVHRPPGSNPLNMHVDKATCGKNANGELNLHMEVSTMPGWTIFEGVDGFTTPALQGSFDLPQVLHLYRRV